jgi:hypothetical protein
VLIVGWRDGAEASLWECFVVSHEGARVIGVRLPEGWRVVCRAVGLDDASAATKGYLITLAKLAFQRSLQ